MVNTHVIKQVLHTAVTYYQHSRAVGHTAVMLNGLNNSARRTILVGSSRHLAVALAREATGKGSYEVLPMDVVGFAHNAYNYRPNNPLVFDNSALKDIFETSLLAIQGLEENLELISASRTRLENTLDRTESELERVTAEKYRLELQLQQIKRIVLDEPTTATAP